MVAIIKESCGFSINRLYKRRETDEVYSLEMHAITRTHSFLSFLYKDSSVYLDRKYAKYNEMLKDLYSRPCKKLWGL